MRHGLTSRAWLAIAAATVTAANITLGANGAYTAGPGYDLVTGLGTPDITKLVNGA